MTIWTGCIWVDGVVMGFRDSPALLMPKAGLKRCARNSHLLWSDDSQRRALKVCPELSNGWSGGGMKPLSYSAFTIIVTCNECARD